MKMNWQYFFLFLIISLQFINGKSITIDEECIPINELFNKSHSNNCCLENGIFCENDHITAM